MKGSTLAMNKNKFVYTAFLAIAFAATFSACKDKRSTGLEYARNMYDPIAYNPDQPNKNFKDGKTAQLPPAHTKPVGFTEYDEYPNTKEGYEAAGVSMVNPLPVDTVNLAQGKHLFTVFCSPCHGEKGDGQGHLVKIEKFSGVPAYQTGSSSRGGNMVDLTAGKIYHTITYGVNNMGSHASQISPTDRWKVVMYVQQLQKGQ
ncbi:MULTISPECIES: cytochrome c [Pedobacter]|jgi:mono/diheme cytochrome c family protein|uniref:Cytochrome c n=3 Tax=Pedobacter TaxID=84567 RepID=A0A497Y3Z7_9SPHI|nr:MULTISPECIES: cytochrome c [Pedobacter]MCX2494067.1 cytochrome c [Pedobacter sp. PF22-3]RLJ77234.1 quinol:cytochrome c oxidoreductase monoheme cytochrome subunit [Pedobacter alluvionis]TFB33540.1 cytochrome c [Pedobacter alluvionis]SDG24279.1 Cytochrome C oxidase, cbb3-type, subunit III [Pedobacter terrae]